MNIKLLTEHNLEFLSLTAGYTGSSESTRVEMPHCWKSHVTAQICFFNHYLGHTLQGIIDCFVICVGSTDADIYAKISVFV